MHCYIMCAKLFHGCSSLMERVSVNGMLRVGLHTPKHCIWLAGPSPFNVPCGLQWIININHRGFKITKGTDVSPTKARLRQWKLALIKHQSRSSGNRVSINLRNSVQVSGTRLPQQVDARRQQEIPVHFSYWATYYKNCTLIASLI